MEDPAINEQTCTGAAAAGLRRRDALHRKLAIAFPPIGDELQ